MAKFDIEESAVRKLAELLEETGLSEIEVTNGDKSIRISRSVQSQAVVAPAAAALPAGTALAPETGQAAEREASGDAVTAPMVGVVYLSPEPGAANFVKPGDTVNEGDTLLLIAAMKTFNPVRAPRSGKVTNILVSDKTPVEFGEELVIIE